MIFKALYQETKHQVPLRENTKALYIKADSKAEARAIFDEKTPYNIEYLEAISDAHLEYDREHNPDFTLLER